jgi:hypothetical protein
MKTNWRGSKLGVIGASAAAIAVAAVPDNPEQTLATPGWKTSGARRAAIVRPGGQAEPQLDVARLQRIRSVSGDPVAIAGAARDEESALVEPAAQALPPSDPAINPFATKSWYVPPPPPPIAKPLPPPKPTAPPLPFAYVGRYDSGDEPPVILLLRGDRLYTVSEGEPIDDSYRLDRIDPGRIEITYLPLQETQVLQTGEPG